MPVQPPPCWPPCAHRPQLLPSREPPARPFFFLQEPRRVAAPLCFSTSPWFSAEDLLAVLCTERPSPTSPRHHVPSVIEFSVGFEICTVIAERAMRPLRVEGRGPQMCVRPGLLPGVLLGAGTEPGGGAFPHLPHRHRGAGWPPADARTGLWSFGWCHFPPAQTPSSSFFSLAYLGSFRKVWDTFRPILQLLLPPRSPRLPAVVP